MRRDIGFYIEANVQRVYQAYLDAATHKPFERSCNEEPWHTISFGVNFSMKYNMNGGTCHIHFMPWGNGTAVNMRFSLAQAMGARYERYAEDLNRAMQAYLPVTVQPAAYNMDDFLKPENQISSAPRPYVVAPAAPAAPVALTCAQCGSELAAGARFCSHCGAPVAAPKERICPNCQNKEQETASFCSNCGTKL